MNYHETEGKMGRIDRKRRKTWATFQPELFSA
jgi:hypothetical protein